MVAVVAVVAGALGWVHTQAQAHHAAGTAARVAITQPDDAAVSAAHRIAPGAQVDIEREPPWIIVTVSISGSGPWPTARATAHAHDQ